MFDVTGKFNTAAVAPTAEILDILTPVYNFKASKAVTDEETADGED